MSRGRHVVEYVQGDDVSMPFQAPDLNSAMQRVGRLLRDLRDAAPWNLVLNAARWVLIDWDTTAPGSRLWDLAYAAHAFIPIAPDTAPSAAGGFSRR